jgi:hypothetical protein
MRLPEDIREHALALFEESKAQAGKPTRADMGAPWQVGGGGALRPDDSKSFPRRKSLPVSSKHRDTRIIPRGTRSKV